MLSLGLDLIKNAETKQFLFSVISQIARDYVAETQKNLREENRAHRKARDEMRQAKALLEEAGYGDGLELTILGTQDAVLLYTVIQENLRQIGITVNIETPDVPTFVGAANAGDYDLIQVGDYCDFRYPPVMMSLRWANINTFTIGGTKYTTEELENSIYAKRVNCPVETLRGGRDAFLSLDIKAQAKALMNIQQIFGRIAGGIDLTAIGGAGKAAATVNFSTTISNWAKNYRDVRLIDASPSGLWEKRSDNLLELL